MARVRAAKALHDELVALEDARRFHAAGDPFAGGARPRVTVRIPTWHGHETLLERTLPSVLVAPWEGVEVVVCSDGPDPDARRAVEGLRDARVRYLELPERPVYPSHPQNLWRVGGIHAVNHALDAAAEGSFIAPLDHDDAFTLGHVPELLAVLERSGADLAYGQALCELADGAWVINGSAPLAHGEIAHGAVLYSPRLQHVRLDPDAWLLAEPGDWNCWRRMDAAGAHAVHLPRPVLVHFQERTALGDEQQSDRAFSEPTDAEALRDVRATSAAFLLDVRFL
jgi:hypothetical protein